MRFTALVALAIVMLNVHGLAVPAPSPTRVSSSDNPSPIRTKRVDVDLNYTSDRSDGRLANRTPATTVKRDTAVQVIGTAVNELSWYKGLLYRTLKRDTTFDSIQPVGAAVNDLALHPTATAILERDTTIQLIRTSTGGVYDPRT
ncbi:hypothetical protein EV702DRAFT_134787 [Suillus placidus]|uniref:Uncharacterized protein n=1 Tax=Suillus placidus TaxID=48579 RepID=A0A9P7D4F1_9AGAM|nr:hypothetical protein EV702DRAFT_134787 [Suillus placidus]